MNLINYYTSSEQKKFSFLVFVIFSLFPLSYILGNLAININIILADLSLIFYSIIFNDWKWTKDKFFKLLLIIQFYIIFNSIYSIFFKIDENLYVGLYRSIGFLRYILLIFSFSLINKLKINFDNLMKIWSLIIFIIIFDVFFEKIFSKNLLGYESLNNVRIVSFFKDEMVVGSFMLVFGFPIATYWINKENKKYFYKLFFNFLFILIPLTIFISGERSNFIKSIMIFSILFFFISTNRFFIRKKKIIFIIFISFISIFYLNENIRMNYMDSYKRITNFKDNKGLKKFENVKYFHHYYLAWEIFRKNPFLGIGSKNFRFECSKPKYFNKDLNFSVQGCSTHPHQVHFELLSEHGLIGYILILGIILTYAIKNLISSYKKRDILKFSLALYIIAFFTPLLPSGSLFATFAGTGFWIILGLIYYLNKNEKDKIL